MSKAIGRALGAGLATPPVNGTENNILNYLQRYNIPQPDNTMLLAGLRTQNPITLAIMDQQKQLNNLQRETSLNPALQQQYNNLLLQSLQNQIQKQDIWQKLQQMSNNFANAVKAGVVGYATGASLGNFDEALGGTATTLGMDYQGARDAVRQLQHDLSQQYPYLYGGAEFIGAATTPIQLFNGASKVGQISNAVADTINASAGYAENWNDFGTNLIANGIANGIGLSVEKLPIYRAIGIGGRKALTQGVNTGINYITDKTKNIFFDDDM